MDTNDGSTDTVGMLLVTRRITQVLQVLLVLTDLDKDILQGFYSLTVPAHRHSTIGLLLVALHWAVAVAVRRSKDTIETVLGLKRNVFRVDQDQASMVTILL